MPTRKTWNPEHSTQHCGYMVPQNTLIHFQRKFGSTSILFMRARAHKDMCRKAMSCTYLAPPCRWGDSCTVACPRHTCIHLPMHWELKCCRQRHNMALEGLEFENKVVVIIQRAIQKRRYLRCRRDSKAIQKEEIFWTGIQKRAMQNREFLWLGRDSEKRVSEQRSTRMLTRTRSHAHTHALTLALARSRCSRDKPPKKFIFGRDDVYGVDIWPGAHRQISTWSYAHVDRVYCTCE